ncbi:uncharacterized protein Z518_06367 [Rhinocladiella mackenziei CBS 650.93]|uniref:Uncharacterized protein n=1 Tax=Rhinocladiella mackenziei CBS 650.93 TaxID=1442369 RepID=A0A0D2J8R8_9EURO|nr:uncharacterized protein Z518_06367 [Rhinocladiella mackenziei CBS 650.93]KIX05495.1 hypothetical protein Z518_06367 [Rhinocladiella mackenziei CBS 650.93]
MAPKGVRHKYSLREKNWLQLDLKEEDATPTKSTTSAPPTYLTKINISKFPVAQEWEKIGDAKREQVAKYRA